MSVPSVVMAGAIVIIVKVFMQHKAVPGQTTLSAYTYTQAPTHTSEIANYTQVTVQPT